MGHARPYRLTPTPTPSAACAMATLEPRGVDDIPSIIEHHPAITTTLNADIETLTTFKDTLEATPVKPIFESIIVILTLVRVRLLVLFLFLHLLISNTVRTR